MGKPTRLAAGLLTHALFALDLIALSTPVLLFCAVLTALTGRGFWTTPIGAALWSQGWHIAHALGLAGL